MLSVPATSAPVERIFSQGRLIMRPHRAKMGDEMLELLFHLHCNGNYLIRLCLWSLDCLSIRWHAWFHDVTVLCVYDYRQDIYIYIL